MPKGYWIPHLDVSEPGGLPGLPRHGGRARTSASAPSCWRAAAAVRWSKARCARRNVLREFNSYDEALAFYHSPEYSRAHPLREPHSACDFLIVEGYDGPQPPPIGTPPAAAALKGYWIAQSM